MHIYMESIKMVLMKLFAGKERRCRCREQACGHSEEEEESEKNGDSSINIYPPSRVEQVVGAALPCNTPGSLRCLRGVKWGGGREVHEGRDTCTIMTDLHYCMGRNQHNIVKQFSSSLKKIFLESQLLNTNEFCMPVVKSDRGGRI